MRQIAVVLIVFFIGMNAFAGFLQATGIAQSHNLDTTTGDPSQLEEAQQTGKEASVGKQSAIDSLFGPILSMWGVVQDIWGAIFPAMDMLRATPIPNPVVNYVESFMGIVFGISAANFIRGM